MVTPSRIIGFYDGTHPDHRGRYLREIRLRDHLQPTPALPHFRNVEPRV
jgi:hypothetical protein